MQANLSSSAGKRHISFRFLIVRCSVFPSPARENKMHANLSNSAKQKPSQKAGFFVFLWRGSNHYRKPRGRVHRPVRTPGDTASPQSRQSPARSPEGTGFSFGKGSGFSKKDRLLYSYQFSGRTHSIRQVIIKRFDRMCKVVDIFFAARLQLLKKNREH